MLTNDKEMSEIVKNAKKNKLSKSELRELQEKQIREVIEEKMDIRGSYEKPSIYDVLWVQIIIFPYTFVKYITWFSMWTLNFTILGKEYGDEEKLYLIRKNLGMGVHQFNALEEDEIEQYLDMELWKKENYQEWKHEQDEEMKLKMAQNNRYKSYRRWMKNNKSRMTFED
jgi:DnaJ homolog subfamily C member 25